MTALKPIDNRRVRGVASERYPVNERCAHPDCNEPATVHHIFPRSLTKSDSYFVAIREDNPDPDSFDIIETVVPHAVGLCGSGTTGHHGDVEEHRAWIKLEEGEFVWYDRGGREREEGWLHNPDYRPLDTCDAQWAHVGPLNPQPGSREGKPKRRRLSGDDRAKRKTISFRVPDDAERGSEVFDALLEACKEQLVVEGLKDDEQKLTTYVALTAVMGSWLQA